MEKAKKSFYRIETHLRSEYRWAYTSRQAALHVWREYRKHSLNMTFEEALRSWRAYRRVD